VNLDLVLQGPALSPAHVAELRALVRPDSERWTGARAARLAGFFDDEARVIVARYAAEQGIDFAFVEPGRRLADFRLLAMDMDSTLIAIECIDEIADMRGIRREVATVTESAMRGEIDFRESLRRRVALLAGLEESALQRVYDERLRLSPGAEIMMQALKQNGVKTLLVSGGFDFFTGRLKARLGLDYTLSNTLEVKDGRLTGKVAGEIVDAEWKARRLRELARELGASRDQLIALGDGANDLPMLAEAGVSIGYHAKPAVKAKTRYAFDHVGLDGVLALFPA
jgi:phosphoserine phosphatase